MNKVAKRSLIIGAVAAATLVGGHLPKHVSLGKKDKVVNLQKQLAAFAKMTLANANGMNSASILKNIRYGIGLVAGYSDRAAYIDLVCGTDPGAGQSCDGPPQNGIVGTITDVVNELPRIAMNAGITSCDSIPSNGDYTSRDSSGNSVTLHFATPTHAVPAGWLNAGTTFGHRVEFSTVINDIGPSAVPLGVAMEFSCGDLTANYTAVSMDVDSVGLPNYYRDIAILNGPVDSLHNGIEVYMAEHINSPPMGATAVRTTEAFRIYYSPSDSTFKLWGIEGSNFKYGPSGSQTDMMLAARIVVAGNYSTGVAKAYFNGAFFRPGASDPSGGIPSSVTGVSWASANGAPVTTPPSFNMTADLTADTNITSITQGNKYEYERMGCVNFGLGTSVAPSDAACASLSLSSEATGPSLDAGGHFSLAWATATLPGLLEHTSY